MAESPEKDSVVSPEPQVDSKGELSDNELSQVSGGFGAAPGLDKLQVEPVDFKPKSPLIGPNIQPLEITPTER